MNGELKLAFAAIDNRLLLDEAALLQNLQAVQTTAGIPAVKVRDFIHRTRRMACLL